MDSTNSTCLDMPNTSLGLFNGDNSFHFAFPLLTFQIAFSSSVATIVSYLLAYIGMPEMVSQILAGMLVGPIGFGQIEGFQALVFPAFNIPARNVVEYLGLIFLLFLIGVQSNPAMVSMAGRKAQVVGILVIVVPLTLSITSYYVITGLFSFDDQFSLSLFTVAIVESTTSFPVIACYLTELNILNSEFSRVAFSSSMITGLLSFALMGVYSTFELSRNMNVTIGIMLMIILYAIVVMVVVFGIRPVIRRISKRLLKEQKMKDEYLCFVMISALLLTWVCGISQLEFLFGPFILGMIIPSGPPFGSALVDRFEFLITWTFMPLYYSSYGMSLNFQTVNPRTALIVGLMVLIGCTGKFLGAFIPALFFNMSYKDAILLGLTMNAQGFFDIVVFTFLSRNLLIDKNTFPVMCAMILVITGTITPLVRYLYKSSTQYKLYYRRTIQHSEADSELRVLACVYGEENVPSIIHLLKAANPTKASPMNVSVVHFVELVGRATPAIIYHKSRKKRSATSAAAVSQPIINVLRMYEEKHRGSISMHPYTVVSSYESMHDDMCSLAFRKGTSLVILPYHTQWDIGVMHVGIKTVNLNVLEKAPCSVGILIDRGILGGVKFALATWSSYHVLVVFLGGPDDREALSLGARMSGHPTIELTVIRLLTEFDKAHTTMDKNVDDELIDDFNLRIAYNDRVSYIEEEVEDGLEAIRLIESMGDRFELIILGRRHDKNLPLIVELTDFNKCSELGTVGDVFMKSGLGVKATLLVVQQQTKVAARSYDSILDEEGMQTTSKYDC